MSFIDRRLNGKGKSTGNRARFIRRVQDVLKDALPDLTRNRKLTDLDKGGKVKISRKTLSEPSIHNGSGGIRDYVIPGNKEFIPGDSIQKPKSGQGRGKSATNSDEDSTDDFVVELSREEFLDLFFDGLELPDLVKKDIIQMDNITRHTAGWVSEGAPSKLSVVKSMKNSLARRIAIKAARERKVNDILEQLEDSKLTPEQRESSIIELDKIANRKLLFIEELDLQYHNTVIRNNPSTHATMILIQDVSGSMGEYEKTVARKFFFLMYCFLKKHYAKVDLRFIIHTTHAWEVDENEFFETQVSGGTVVSAAIDLATDIIAEYQNKSNIYICQLTDGDNWPDDNANTYEAICEIMPKIQYFAYGQISSKDVSDNDNNLWNTYHKLSEKYNHFNPQMISDETEIFAAFKKLFEKK